MKKATIKLFALMFAFTMLFNFNCKDPGNGGDDDPDIKLPTGTASPSTGTAINGTVSIAITFSETMDKDTLSLAGTMAALSDGGVWSDSATDTDDILTISPASPWDNGNGTLSIDCNDLSGNMLDTMELSYPIDTVTPTGDAAPATGVVINGSREIVITFNETMDDNALVLGGDMAALSDGGVWSDSTTKAVGDTLTINPSTAWTDGAGKTLTIDCDDMAGNSMTQISLSFDIESVAPTGSSSPATGAPINGSKPIVITFTETMDIGTLAISGDLASQSNGGAWTEDNATNDTLTISPSGTWSIGDGLPQSLIIDCGDLAGNSLDTLNLSYNVDLDDPNGTPDPGTDAKINGSKVIVVTFNETMDPNTLVIGGELDASDDGRTWSGVSVANDTLTISPLVPWGDGNDRALTIDCDDLAGNSAATISLSYDIESIAPTGTESPTNDTTITSDTNIVITFSESMDTSSLSLSGSLLTNGYSTSWGTVTYTNDQLTVEYPSGPPWWPVENDKTLNIDCKDLFGNQLTTIELIYDVID